MQARYRGLAHLETRSVLTMRAGARKMGVMKEMRIAEVDVTDPLSDPVTARACITTPVHLRSLRERAAVLHLNERAVRCFKLGGSRVIKTAGPLSDQIKLPRLLHIWGGRAPRAGHNGREVGRVLVNNARLDPRGPRRDA